MHSYLPCDREPHSYANWHPFPHGETQPDAHLQTLGDEGFDSDAHS